MIRVLLIPSSDYLGHPFPQRHNQIFERVHDGKEFEVHVLRFNIFGKARLSSRCILHEFPLEFRTESTPLYYISNAALHFKEILKIVRQDSIDVVVAGNLLPPLLLELAKAISGLRLPFIFDLQDYYPSSAAGYLRGPMGILGSAAKGAFETMTRALLRAADAVTAPGIALASYAIEARKEAMAGAGASTEAESESGTEPGTEHVYTVPNGISEHFLKPHDGKAVREALGYGAEDLVVGYVGSIEFWLDMRTLIKAVSIARRRKVNVKFMLIGGRLQTGYSELVEGWIRKEGIGDVTKRLGFIRHEEVPEYMAAMDIGTIPFDLRNATAYYAAPNKLWEYLSQGVRVASTPIPEVLAFRSLVQIAMDEDGYVEIFKEAEAEGKRGLKGFDPNRVKEYLANRTWSRSAEKFKEIIRFMASCKKR
ncbi:MAG: glycosyltransferase [Candidatus Bathyarchaeia archaeon]